MIGKWVKCNNYKRNYIQRRTTQKFKCMPKLQRNILDYHQEEE